ncbi:tetraacyldisaccharide 4'-kinase [Christiangramia salexigens]|uniref:Tetraacyldisaccharide 4'-kinase n=1 Tax=Christiangramia salexigens TaxID=1913577 RepID=A0A1L3J849_9FLAO|nr:tetraacyldisaccharide 4'-kinase [Christiangramia salexigens]APG61273.1 tetraacyldisaccharide 4'-kinase [Christiangramia salexigens]
MPNPRKLLYPFSVLYHAVTGIRNELYDHNFLKSASFSVPVICVGNLSVGGTGKSPMTEYLIKYLRTTLKVAVLSRGYKRKTKGFKLVQESDDATMVGDEPLQFKNKFPDALVAVDANRKEGIAKLMSQSPGVVLLDDAFQHRKVKADLNIVLTPFNDLYVDDLLLPAGNLRESSSGASRADIIIVTKCPLDLSEKRMNDIAGRLKATKDQEVYFTGIRYSEKIISGNNNVPLNTVDNSTYTLVTGIANPEPLIDYLNSLNIELKHFEFPDHHSFSEKEIEKLAAEKNILTTEKDYMRLRLRLDPPRLYYLPIEIQFLNKEKDFKDKITSYVK